MNTLLKALDVVLAQANQKDAIQVLLDSIQEKSEESLWEFLAAIGMFQSPFTYSYQDLDCLYAVLGTLSDASFPFAQAIFDQHIKQICFKSIIKKLNHPIFDSIRPMLSRSVLFQLLSLPNLPQSIDPSWVEAFIPGNYDNFSTIPKDAFITIGKRFYRQGSDTRTSEGSLLASKFQKIYDEMNCKDNQCIFLFDLTEQEIILLQRLSLYFFTGVIRSQDLTDFIEVWGSGGLLFFSCCLCARVLIKETNRDFWLEYYQWLDVLDREGKKYSQSTVNQLVKDFLNARRIPYVISFGGNSQFVLTFLMHSIVSNRPLSKNLAVRFLVKVVKGTGTVYHDLEDQQKVLMQQLALYSQPVQEESESQNITNSYLQLPRETAYAFLASPTQVVDYLLPIYDFLEKHLIDRVNKGTTFFSLQTEAIPDFIRPEVEKIIDDTTVEDIIKMRSMLKVCREGKASMVLDTNEWKLNFIIPPYIFTELDKNAHIDFQLFDSSRVMCYQKIDVTHDTVNSALVTKEFAIPCTFQETNFMYQFSYKGKALVRGPISYSYLFDFQGEPMVFPCSSAQPVYCLAKPGTIIAEELLEVLSTIIPGFSLWESYLSEYSPIVIDSTLYGINTGTSSRNFGYTLGNGNYQQVRFLENKVEYPVIGGYPTFFLRYPSKQNVEEDIRISIDGLPAPYSIISQSVLSDGSGEIFFRIMIDPTFALDNGKLIRIRMVSALRGQDLLAFSAFVLKNLEYKFSKELYYNDKNVSLDSLEFEGKEQLFFGHYYNFPAPLSKFKLSLKTEGDNRLLFIPPLISVTNNGRNLLNHDCWYSDLCGMDDITVIAPDDITSIKLSTWDSQGYMQHDLKKRGKKYKVQYLQTPPETDDRYVTLKLTGFRRNKQRIDLPLCKLYYKLTPKPSKNGPISYIAPSINFRFSNFKTGLKIKIDFFCKKDGVYTVRLFDSGNKLIASWAIQDNGSSEYYQEADLPSGIYTLKVFETTVNQFTKIQKEDVVYSQQLPYKVKDAKSAGLPPVKVSEPTLPSYTSHDIHVLCTLKRLICPNKIIYEPNIELASFHLKVKGNLVHDGSFDAVGFFFDRLEKRYEMTQYNPFKVTVKTISEEGKIILSITDREGKPLMVGERSGKVNPFYSDGHERLHECRLFEGIVIR